MGLLPTGTGDWLAFETRGMVRFFPVPCGFFSLACPHKVTLVLAPGDVAPVN